MGERYGVQSCSGHKGTQTQTTEEAQTTEQEEEQMMELDRSIAPLILLLNQRLRIFTSCSCSGLLADHPPDRYDGMSTPYLVVIPNTSDPYHYHQFRRLMIRSGFISNSTSEHLLRWAETHQEALSKYMAWEGRLKDQTGKAFHFFFGADDWKGELQYRLLDEPYWQQRIRQAWALVYRRSLQLLTA